MKDGVVFENTPEGTEKMRKTSA